MTRKIYWGFIYLACWTSLPSTKMTQVAVLVAKSRFTLKGERNATFGHKLKGKFPFKPLLNRIRFKEKDVWPASQWAIQMPGVMSKSGCSQLCWGGII